VGVFETPCGHHNGHTLDPLGRIIACEHSGRRVSRLEHDGRWQTLADRFEGMRLNSPNDVVVKSDGSIWFSDPTYGIDSDYEGFAAASEIGAANVYRIDPIDGSVSLVASDLVKPNGLAFSPDESILYVSDTGATHVPGHPPTIRAYPVAPDQRSLGPGQLFATCDRGLFDGFRVDRHGNVLASSGDSVRVYAPDGTLIGRILVPETVSNLCFGGPRRNRLFITATTSLYAIYVNTAPAGFVAPAVP
jgi:gluconolactonase